MDHLTPIVSLPIQSPGIGAATTEDGRREDGSFDFTQFFAHFDLNSDVANFLENSFDPGKFLAELRLACSPPPIPPQSSTSRFSRRRSEPLLAAMIEYQAKIEERQRGKEYLNKDLEALDDVVNKMDKAHVPGVEQLKKDFIAAKSFIFDAIAHSSSRALEFHLEGIEDLIGTSSLPSTPYTRAPRLEPVELPVITPLAEPGTPLEKWPSMLTGSTGLVYRIVATPLELATDTMNYFRITPPTPLHETKQVDGSSQSIQDHVSGSPKTPPAGRRPASSWNRSLSGFSNRGDGID